MHSFFRYFFHFLSLLNQSKQPLIINNHTQTTVRDSIVKDTIRQTIQDSAFLQLYLSCIDGRVVIDKELQKMSKDLKMIYSIENGMLKVQADYYKDLQIEIEKLYRIIEKTKETTVIQPPPDQPKQPKSNWWERLIEVLTIAGVVFIIILMLRKL